MGKYSIENSNAGTFFVYKMDHGDELDTFGLGMMTNNKIPNFLPLSFTSDGADRYFKFNITSKVTLKQFLAGAVTRERCFALLKSMTDIFQACDDYMLSPSCILTGRQQLFVDVSECRIFAVCIPVLGNPAPDYAEYFRTLISQMTFDTSEAADYPAFIINCINKMETFVLENFREQIAAKSTAITHVSELESCEEKVEEEEVSLLSRIFGCFKRKGRSGGGHIRIPDIDSTVYHNKERVEPEPVPGALDFGEPRRIPEELYDGMTTLLSDYKLEAGALRKPYILRVRTGEELEVNGEIFRIGTEKTYVDLAVEDNTAISRSHADIFRRDGAHYVVDNNSTNGTKLNGELLIGGEEKLIYDGDELMLADETFIFTRK